jgi:outer membrane cobalamin receptor
VRGSFGRSYRLPSFNDLYWPEGPFTAGNPDLKPEKGLGYDLGGLINFQKNGHWGVEVNYFHTDLKNMILWIPDSVGVFRPQNIQDATIKGAEGKLTFQGFGDLLDVAADYTYLDAVDNSADPALKGKQLIYRPKHKVDFSATLTIQRLELTASHVIVARRFTTADNSGVLRKYKLTSVSGAWRQPLAGGHLRIQLEVRNLFDKHIEIIKDFPAPGREWRTALGFAF